MCTSDLQHETSALAGRKSDDEGFLFVLDEELTTPSGTGWMPLSCAAQWIGTNGNSLDPGAVSDEIWVSTLEEHLLPAMALGKVAAQDGLSGSAIPASRFHALPVFVPSLPQQEDEPWECHRIYLQSYPYSTDEEWRDGFDDALMPGDQYPDPTAHRHKPLFQRIMVARTDIARVWPFHLPGSVATEAIETPAAILGRPRTIRRIATEALLAEFPNGIPRKCDIRWTDLAIVTQIKKRIVNDGQNVSDATIKRAPDEHRARHLVVVPGENLAK